MRDEEKAKQEDSPSAKKPKLERFPFTRWEFTAALGSSLSSPPTFMIPGTIFMSLLAGALFGVVRGLFLVVFNATAGASSCFFLSKLIGRPIVNWFWPDKLRVFQAEIAKRKEKLLNYMLFLRVTPTLPNLFINLASPIVDIPFHVFFLATLLGLIPASYITVRAGLALGDLKSVKDLYDFKTLSMLFLIGSIIIFPTLLKRKRIYE
ncbi:hypothetical protein GH714_017940 [Hevea brasiliensis]|uniref:VTT domain-containing protein n=1 Tax=Hevea brasiliensis TaxID=3981 RepID=A0A6A6KU56_HEVBR|nr:hypothetical protein GH714_017940 [Hevea brasiliensis]